MKLRLGLQRVGSIVFGRVLEQDESLRTCSVLTSGDGDVIKSVQSVVWPQLTNWAILIRGTDGSKDNDWFACDYGNADSAVEAVADIKELVAVVNGKQDDLYDPYACGLEVIE